MAELKPAPAGYPIKLVRDRTPEIVNSSGEPGRLWYEKRGRIVGPPVSPAGSQMVEERIRLLRLKLAEELGEYLVDGGIEELADVQAVVDALAEAHGEPPVEFRARVNHDPRGGFFDGVVMVGRHDEFDGGAVHEGDPDIR